MAELAQIPYRFEDCVPHASPMALLDSSLEFAPGRLRASATLGPDSLFAEAAGVPAWVGMEYMAQAAAAYAGVMARQKGQKVKLGFLVGSRRYESSASHLPQGATLVIDVAEEIYNPDGLSVLACTISADGKPLATANLNVFQPKDPAAYLEAVRSG